MSDYSWITDNRTLRICPARTLDLVIIVLVAEACDLGLTHEDAGFWSTVASVNTLVAGLSDGTNRLIRRGLNADPIVLFKDGKLHKTEMRRHMVDEEDLNEIAREQGRESFKEFKAMLLEGDGEISAIQFKSDKDRYQVTEFLHEIDI